MSCCDSRVILKKSTLGTCFFAHARRGPCSSAPESAEHLLAKETIARTLRTTDWQVSTEVRGTSHDGQEWIADVMATRGDVKIAIEVQLSRQTLEETERRQNRYRLSGVRGLWLCKQTQVHLSKEIPSFRITLGRDNKFEIQLPSEFYDADVVNSRRGWHEPEDYWGQSIDLSEFVAGAVNGALRWAPAIEKIVPFRVKLGEKKCWKCTKKIRAVIGVQILIHDRLPEHPDADIELPDLDEIGTPRELLELFFPSDDLARLGVAPIKQRSSKTARAAYLSNGCIHCGAIQGQFYSDRIKPIKPAFSGEIKLTRDLVDSLHCIHHQIHLWWFERN